MSADSPFVKNGRTSAIVPGRPGLSKGRTVRWTRSAADAMKPSIKTLGEILYALSQYVILVSAVDA